MRYHVYLEGEPTLEAYRLHHDPRDGLSPVFICPFVVLTDADGTPVTQRTRRLRDQAPKRRSRWA